MADIIALMGSKGAGKDTVAKFIKKHNKKYDRGRNESRICPELERKMCSVEAW